MQLINRVKNIIITPKTEWDVINAESATPKSLFTGYVLPLAIVAAIGPLLSGVVYPGSMGLRFFLTAAVVALVSTIVGFYVALYIIDLLAPSFGSEKNLNKSAQLVAYASTPSNVASFLSFIPVIGRLLSLAGWLYSIYVMYLGVGPLKKTPEDKKVIYLVVAWLLMFGAIMVISAILGMILYGTSGFLPMRTMGG